MFRIFIQKQFTIELFSIKKTRVLTIKLMTILERNVGSQLERYVFSLWKAEN